MSPAAPEKAQSPAQLSFTYMENSNVPEECSCRLIFIPEASGSFRYLGPTSWSALMVRTVTFQFIWSFWGGQCGQQIAGVLSCALMRCTSWSFPTCCRLCLFVYHTVAVHPRSDEWESNWGQVSLPWQMAFPSQLTHISEVMSVSPS